MNRVAKFYEKLLNEDSSQGYAFAEMCRFLEKIGFSCRVKGSHYIFSRREIVEIINLQPKGKFVKDYQVRQVRRLLKKYNLMDGFIK